MGVMAPDTTTVSAELVLVTLRTKTVSLRVRHTAPGGGRVCEIWSLPDGRWLAESERFGVIVRPSLAHHGVGEATLRWTAERRSFDVSQLMETLVCVVDWASMHDCIGELDRVRRDGPAQGIGVRVTGDVLGGNYRPRDFRGMTGLVRLALAVEEIARDAWRAVHSAGLAHDMERGRHGVRVALAVARARDLLVKAGVMAKGARICSSDAPGYGLAGLGWLSGHGLDIELPHEAVEAFAAGFDLPTAKGVVGANGWRKKSQ